MDGLSLLRNRYCVCGKYYSQLVEDVRVYDRVLTPEEIANMFFARGVDGITVGGISRYRLKEGAPGAVASAVKDIWSRNNGTQTGDPVYAKGTTRSARRVA